MSELKDNYLNIAGTITGSSNIANRYIDVHGSLSSLDFFSKKILAGSLKAKTIMTDYLKVNKTKFTGLLALATTPLCMGSKGQLSYCASSQIFKHNIEELKASEELNVLTQISSTPLNFYNHNEDNPNHKRMGLIAEALPSFLKVYQTTVIEKNGKLIKVKNTYPSPDWFSVKGYLWAGVKALHKLFKVSQIKIKQLSTVIKTLTQSLLKTKKNLQSQISVLKQKNQILASRLNQLENQVKALLKNK